MYSSGNLKRKWEQDGNRKECKETNCEKIEKVIGQRKMVERKKQEGEKCQRKRSYRESVERERCSKERKIVWIMGSEKWFKQALVRNKRLENKKNPKIVQKE